MLSLLGLQLIVLAYFPRERSAVFCEEIIMERNFLVTKARNLSKDRSELNRKCIICVPLSLPRNIKGFE